MRSEEGGVGSEGGEGWGVRMVRGEDCTFTCIHELLVHVHEYVQCRSCDIHSLTEEGWL